MSTFFKELTSFSDFALFRKDDHYQPVPDDWWVIITDVKGFYAGRTRRALSRRQYAGCRHDRRGYQSSANARLSLCLWRRRRHALGAARIRRRG